MECKFTGSIVTSDTEVIYERIRAAQCDEMKIHPYTFNQVCGVVSLGWCYTIVDEKQWVLARLKYGF